MMDTKLGAAADANTAAAAGEHNPGADLVIAEGVSGTFYYHLALATDTSRGLCGARTMPTMIPLAGWGQVGHLKERYCSRCEVDQVRRQERVTGKVKETKKKT